MCKKDRFEVVQEEACLIMNITVRQSLGIIIK